jgi:hypothetical protein
MLLVGKKIFFPYTWIEATQNGVRTLLFPQRRWRSLVFTDALPEISEESDIPNRIGGMFKPCLFEKRREGRVPGA